MAERGISCSKFDAWWQHWPRGHKTGKIACRKSYERQVRILQKAEPEHDPHEYLLAALERFKQSKRVDAGFICAPLTWLNQGRYFDDLELVAKCGCQSNSRMDETTRQEMARARRIKEERTLTLTGNVTTFKPDPSADESFELRTHSLPVGVIDDAGLSPFCPICGAEMFFGKVTEKWQCTSRECFERMLG